MRYHSLIVHEPVPAELEVLATTSEGEIMALKHREHPTYGVQFHRVHLTEHGKKLLKNFLDLKPAPVAGGEQAMLKPFIAKAINRTDLTPRKPGSDEHHHDRSSHIGADRRLSHCPAHEGRDHPGDHGLGPGDARQCRQSGAQQNRRIGV